MALKLIRPELARSPETLARFTQELRLLPASRFPFRFSSLGHRQFLQLSLLIFSTMPALRSATSLIVYSAAEPSTCATTVSRNISGRPSRGGFASGLRSDGTVMLTPAQVGGGLQFKNCNGQ